MCKKLFERVYEKLGYTSLHVYAVQALGFSDDQAYQFTRVALKSMEIPELKAGRSDSSAQGGTIRLFRKTRSREKSGEKFGQADQDFCLKADSLSGKTPSDPERQWPMHLP